MSTDESKLSICYHSYVISLLLAYFGKGKIPDSVRYVLFAIGISLFLYRINKIRKSRLKAQQAYQEAMVIKAVMDKKMAAQALEKQEQMIAEQQATIEQQQATIAKQQALAMEQAKLEAKLAAVTSSDQTKPAPVMTPSSAEVSPQTLAGFFLG